MCCLQENPTPSRCLGVFGLSLYTTEQQIHHIFSKFGPVDKVQVVIDAKVSTFIQLQFYYHTRFLFHSNIVYFMSLHFQFYSPDWFDRENFVCLMCIFVTSELLSRFGCGLEIDYTLD